MKNLNVKYAEINDLSVPDKYIKILKLNDKELLRYIIGSTNINPSDINPKIIRLAELRLNQLEKRQDKFLNILITILTTICIQYVLKKIS